MHQNDDRPSSSGSPATDFSVLLLAELLALGVRDVVLSPGSRSQAIALAAAEFERAGRLRLRVRLDERSAGFLALGIGVETGVPAVIVTTSGTAVANLHPAVLEAHHSGVPVILLTADRPRELRGIGSNQTTDQLGMFGASVRIVREVEAPSEGSVDRDAVRTLAREAFSAAMGHSGSPDAPAAPGPAQVDLAFREPLSARAGELPARSGSELEEPEDPRRGLTPAVPSPTHPGSSLVLDVDHVPGTVVIAGHAAGAVAEDVAHRLGAPLLAEVSSGSRFGPNLVGSYRRLLDDAEFGGAVRRAVVFGHPTLTRQVPALLKRAGVEVIVVRGGVPEAYDPSRAATIVDGVTVAEGGGMAGADGTPSSTDQEHRAWIGRWVQAGRALAENTAAAPDLDAATSDDPAVKAAFLRGEVELLRTPVDRRYLVEALWRVTWPHDRLVLGASRLIREADVFVPGKKIPVHANRGLAGIDGTIATATGIALTSQAGRTHGGMHGDAADGRPGVTRLLVGDLTLLHDVGSLSFGVGESRPRLQVIVGNDGGGTIFDGLEVAGVAPADAMTRVQLTPQSVDIERLAAAYGWVYLRAATRGDLDQALVGSSSADSPLTIIEVPLER